MYSKINACFKGHLNIRVGKRTKMFLLQHITTHNYLTVSTEDKIMIGYNNASTEERSKVHKATQ